MKDHDFTVHHLPGRNAAWLRCTLFRLCASHTVQLWTDSLPHVGNAVAMNGRLLAPPSSDRSFLRPEGITPFRSAFIQQTRLLHALALPAATISAAHMPPDHRGVMTNNEGCVVTPLID
jgi:hypothetical protein